MAEKTFSNVRLGLKVDTLANWNTSNLILKRGEVAFATTAASSGTGLTEPVCIMKIGDGSKKFSQLDNNFYAKASDVISACKSSDALTTFVNNVIANAGIATSEAMETLSGRVDAVEDLVGSTAVATQITNAINALNLSTTYDAKGSAAAVQEALDAYKTSNNTAVAAAKKAGDDAQADVDALETKVTTLIGSDANKSARTIANEELTAKLIPEDAKESLDTLAEIAAWIQEHPDDAAAMNEAIEALEALVGTTSVSSQISAAITALKIGDYAKAADLTAAAERITTLEGKAHTHENATVLNGITSAKIEAWDAVADKADDADLAAIAKSGNVNDLIQTAGDVIVFDCGTSA